MPNAETNLPSKAEIFPAQQSLPWSMLQVAAKWVTDAVSRICLGLLLIVIALWRWLISPIAGEHCRFYPSCSVYLAEALKAHGLYAGMCLGLKRIARCNALFPGGLDPVPQVKTKGQNPRV